MERHKLPKILIFAYKFPPYDMVGANRWKNLSLQLAKHGHEVLVVTTNWWMHSPLPVHPNLRVHRISRNIIGNFRYLPLKGFLHLLRQGFFKFILNRFFLGGGKDEATYWCRKAAPQIERILTEQGFHVLIATGAPFSVNHAAARIKQRVPNILLVQDFRDPWSKNSYDQASSLSRNREDEAVAKADGIISVTDKLLAEFLEGREKKLGRTIENGFDPDLIGSIRKAPPMFQDNSILLTHAGNVSNGREIPLQALLQAITKTSKPFKVLLIGTLDQAARKVVGDHRALHGNKYLQVLPRMPQDEALAIIKSSSFALQLNGPRNHAQVSTKIYEYAGLGVPTLSLNYGGEIENLMRRGNLGVSVDLRNVDIVPILEGLESTPVTPDATEFSFEEKAKQLSGFLLEIGAAYPGMIS